MFRFFTQGFVRVHCKQTRRFAVLRLLLAVVSGLPFASVAGAWEPGKPVELIVPAAAGSDLDQKARLIQDIIVKYNLMKQPLRLVYKSGGAGAAGFLAVKNSKGDAYQILLVDNKIFTVPLATGVPFNWKDTTPVAMLALEQFVLSINSKNGYKSAKEYMESVKTSGSNSLKMGGAGLRSPARFVTVSLEREAATKFEYVAFESGAEAASQLVKQNVDISVTSPAEAISYWRAGALTPQCVFDNVRMTYATKATESQSWNDIPTCREVGFSVEYQTLFGILMPLGVSQDQVNYFVELFKKLMGSPEWKSYMESHAFTQTFKAGPVFTNWLSDVEQFHRQFLVPSHGPRPARQEWPLH